MTPLLSRIRQLLEDLPLRPTIGAALVVGLTVPVAVAAWRGLDQRRETLSQHLAADHARIAETLAIAMQQPIWEVRPDIGRPLVETVMRDPRVAQVRVDSTLSPEFLVASAGAPDGGTITVREVPVTRGDDAIGSVRVAMSSAALEAEVRRQWGQTMLTGLVQVALGLLFVFPLLRLKVLGPIADLVEQSRALAGGALDRPFAWRRADELGDLGRSFEVTRQSLSRLFGDLADRKAELESREGELAAQAALLRTTLDNMTDGICHFGEDLTLRAWNQRFIDIMEYPPNVVAAGTPVERMIRYDIERGYMKAEDPEAYVQHLLSYYRPGLVSETHVERTNGQFIHVRRRPVPGGGFVVSFSDATAEIRAKREAESMLRLLEAVMDAVPAILHVKDRELRYRMVNRGFLDFWRLARDAVIGRTLYELFDAEMLVGFVDRDAEVLASGEPLPFFESLLSRRHGPPANALTTKVPLADDSGRVTHIVTVELDITDRKKAEERLRESEELYRLLIDLAPYGVLLHDRAGVIYINPAGCRTLGLEDSVAAIGRPYIDFVAADEREAAALRVHQVLEEGRQLEPTERRLVTADGRLINAAVAAVPFTRWGKPFALVMFRDITERKRMEEALRESEERFRGIAEAHPLPVVICRRDDGEILYASPAATALCGSAVLIGSSLRDLPADPGEREPMLERLAGDGPHGSYELALERPDGSTFPAAITARSIAYAGARAIVLGIFDLSAQKAAEAEIAKQREALHQGEKLNALGSLLAGVAHELNNPLSVVVGRSVMLEDADLDERTAAAVRKIRLAAERCARIVRTFLAMARQQEPSRVAVGLGDVIADALELVEDKLCDARVRVVKDIEPDLPPTSADPDQLTHVFCNLFLNAQQAMAETAVERVLRVACRHQAADNALVVTVSDTGPGIPTEILPRIFEPFFTTKPAGIGTGIGLAVTHGIIRAHGGEISVGASDDGGTAFTIVLPVRPVETAAGTASSAGEAPRGSRILIVEDDEEIGRMLGDILAAAGHAADVAASGREALDRLRRTRYDLVISDVLMPDIDGLGLYREIQARHREMGERVIFMTGDTVSGKAGSVVDGTSRPLIEKPFVPAEVIATVNTALAAGRTIGEGI